MSFDKWLGGGCPDVRAGAGGTTRNVARSLADLGPLSPITDTPHARVERGQQNCARMPKVGREISSPEDLNPRPPLREGRSVGRCTRAGHRRDQPRCAPYVALV